MAAPTIVTNPPYKYALEFVEHCIKLNAEVVAMFLKLTFLEGQKRQKFFEKYPPKTVAVFSKRVQVAINGDPEMFAKSSAACYAWFIWEKDFKSTVFSGSHSNSVELLEEASVDAIAVFADDAKAIRNAWGKYAGLKKSTNKKNSKKAKVLWVSEPIPNDPFCVRKDFYEAYPKLTHSLMTAILS